MSKTVVGHFSTVAEAEQAQQSLAAQGFDHVTVVPIQPDDSPVEDNLGGDSPDDDSLHEDNLAESTLETPSTTNLDGPVGLSHQFGSIFNGLLGSDREASALLAVLTSTDEQASAAAAALRQLGAGEVHHYATDVGADG